MYYRFYFLVVCSRWNEVGVLWNGKAMKKIL